MSVFVTRMVQPETNNRLYKLTNNFKISGENAVVNNTIELLWGESIELEAGSINVIAISTDTGIQFTTDSGKDVPYEKLSNYPETRAPAPIGYFRITMPNENVTIT